MPLHQRSAVRVLFAARNAKYTSRHLYKLLSSTLITIEPRHTGHGAATDGTFKQILHSLPMKRRAVFQRLI
jgi:hypothetical protein